MSRRPVEEAVTRRVSSQHIQDVSFFDTLFESAYAHDSSLSRHSRFTAGFLKDSFSSEGPRSTSSNLDPSHDTGSILTYNSLFSLVLYYTSTRGQNLYAHLPHAADDASRHENVLHYGCDCVLGKGEGKKAKVDAVTKVLVFAD